MPPPEEPVDQTLGDADKAAGCMAGLMMLSVFFSGLSLYVSAITYWAFLRPGGIFADHGGPDTAFGAVVVHEIVSLPTSLLAIIISWFSPKRLKAWILGLALTALLLVVLPMIVPIFD